MTKLSGETSGFMYQISHVLIGTIRGKKGSDVTISCMRDGNMLYDWMIVTQGIRLRGRRYGVTKSRDVSTLGSGETRDVSLLVGVEQRATMNLLCI